MSVWCLCGKAGTSHLCDGSAHSSGCVVNGSNAMAAFWVIIKLVRYIVRKYYSVHIAHTPFTGSLEGINWVRFL